MFYYKSKSKTLFITDRRNKLLGLANLTWPKLNTNLEGVVIDCRGVQRKIGLVIAGIDWSCKLHMIKLDHVAIYEVVSA